MVGGEYRESIPYASGPVMRYSFGPFLLSFFCQVIEEEVNKDGVDFGVGLEQKNLTAKELNRPDAAA